MPFAWSKRLEFCPRDGLNDEVKALDQDARSALRKHGVRFGQFTVFLPALLKPAPTRLRLVLWSLFAGLSEFPESPPPGLVTIPNLPDMPKKHYTLAGYHPAGARAIRIDMLERLADLLRAKDSRTGFEASSDMLSITGMTLEQFTNLMAGLGYKALIGERLKVKAAIASPATPDESAHVTPERVLEEFESQSRELNSLDASGPETEASTPEVESFTTFTWAPRARSVDVGHTPRRARVTQTVLVEPKAEGDEAAKRGEPKNDRSRDGGGNRSTEGYKGKPNRAKQGKNQGGKDGGANEQQSFSARTPRAEKPIDPDSPFAALMVLKLGK